MCHFGNKHNGCLLVLCNVRMVPPRPQTFMLTSLHVSESHPPGCLVVVCKCPIRILATNNSPSTLTVAAVLILLRSGKKAPPPRTGMGSIGDRGVEPWGPGSFVLSACGHGVFVLSARGHAFSVLSACGLCACFVYLVRVDKVSLCV